MFSEAKPREPQVDLLLMQALDLDTSHLLIDWCIADDLGQLLLELLDITRDASDQSVANVAALLIVRVNGQVVPVRSCHIEGQWLYRVNGAHGHINMEVAVTSLEHHVCGSNLGVEVGRR